MRGSRAAGFMVSGGACLFVGASVGLPATSAAAQTTAQFVVAPFPQATGVSYPAGVTRNEDVEPGIGVAGDGTFWVGSNIDPNVGQNDPRAQTVLSGEDIWRSRDGGRTYQWVADPFNVTPTTPALGGEDSDLTVAPEKNAAGHYNVYATSLYVAASDLAISQDDGASWTLMPLGGIPAQDRPWLSADGPCIFYLTYHQLPLFAPVVNKYDACNQADIGVGLTLNPVQSTPIFLSNTVPGLTNAFNKAFVDNSPSSPHRHNLYVPMEACDLQQPADFLNNVLSTAEQVPNCPQGVKTIVEVAVSTDGGATFSDYVVAHNGNGETQVWPTSLGIDAAGVLYVAWSDNHHSYFSSSRDAGATWSPARRIDPQQVGTSSYPTVAAGPAGVVQVAYYGTPRAGDTNDDAGMGKPGDRASAPWHLYWASSTDGGSTFSTQQVTGVNHSGVLCTMGSSCAGGGARNLYDDFGMAISPTTGRTSIAFDSDQLFGAAPGAQAVDPFTAYATELAPASAGGGNAAGGGNGPGIGASAAGTPTASPNTAALSGGRAVGIAVIAIGVAVGGARRRRSKR